jgi:hypothetical protein
LDHRLRNPYGSRYDHTDIGGAEAERVKREDVDGTEGVTTYRATARG